MKRLSGRRSIALCSRRDFSYLLDHQSKFNSITPQSPTPLSPKSERSINAISFASEAANSQFAKNAEGGDLPSSTSSSSSSKHVFLATNGVSIRIPDRRTFLGDSAAGCPFQPRGNLSSFRLLSQPTYYFDPPHPTSNQATTASSSSSPSSSSSLETTSQRHTSNNSSSLGSSLPPSLCRLCGEPSGAGSVAVFHHSQLHHSSKEVLADLLASMMWERPELSIETLPLVWMELLRKAGERNGDRIPVANDSRRWHDGGEGKNAGTVPRCRAAATLSTLNERVDQALMRNQNAAQRAPIEANSTKDDLQVVSQVIDTFVSSWTQDGGSYRRGSSYLSRRAAETVGRIAFREALDELRLLLALLRDLGVLSVSFSTTASQQVVAGPTGVPDAESVHLVRRGLPFERLECIGDHNWGSHLTGRLRVLFHFLDLTSEQRSLQAEHLRISLESNMNFESLSNSLQLQDLVHGATSASGGSSMKYRADLVECVLGELRVTLWTLHSLDYRSLCLHYPALAGGSKGILSEVEGFVRHAIASLLDLILLQLVCDRLPMWTDVARRYLVDECAIRQRCLSAPPQYHSFSPVRRSRTRVTRSRTIALPALSLSVIPTPSTAVHRGFPHRVVQDCDAKWRLLSWCVRTESPHGALVDRGKAGALHVEVEPQSAAAASPGQGGAVDASIRLQSVVMRMELFELSRTPSSAAAWGQGRSS